MTEPTDPAALARDLERRMLAALPARSIFVGVADLDAICQHLRSLAELREQREGDRDALMLDGAALALDELGAALGAGVTPELRAAFVKAATNIQAKARSLRSTASPAPGKEDQALTNNRPKGA